MFLCHKESKTLVSWILGREEGWLNVLRGRGDGRMGELGL